MARAVIADSDSDDELRFSLSPPLPQRQESLRDDVQVRYFDSTDPASSQSILSEKIEALNQTRDETQCADNILDLEVPVARESRTIVDDSSKTRVHEEVDTAKSTDQQIESSMAQESRPTSLHSLNPGKALASADVWDVPSSLQVQSPSRTLKRGLDGKQSTRSVRVIRGLRKDTEILGYRSQDESNQEDEDDERTAIKERKRIRLSSSAMKANNNSVDKLGVNACRDTKKTAESVSKRPTDGHSSLILATMPLSANQRLEHHNTITHTSSSDTRLDQSCGQDQEASKKETIKKAFLGKLSSLESSDSRTPITRKNQGKHSRRRRQRRDSSVDVLAAVGDESDDVQNSSSAVECKELEMIPPGLHNNDSAITSANADRPAERELHPSSNDGTVQRKRPRGRPRKSLVRIESAAACDVDSKSPVQVKKRCAIREKETMEIEVEAEMGVEVESADKVLQNDSMTSSATNSIIEKMGAGLECGTEKIQTVLVDATKDAGGNGHGVAESIGVGKGNAAKPLHRVGLSKRLKIAPLLQSLRK
ncbi:hypothetical protein CDD82_939 [Ophiocordyceps australis]|uniref:Uncharacterized protein n=1 Tax=Ophiocordyceps australis TaxID=1399860 RepID=A0A2C5Y0C2_9HYPO|nr:hypothetical protein CDD82_939 [Ophiocordyceps australis]